MMDVRYKITFFSEWHTGSGLTSGSDLDALVIKDQNNLPFIPGKTLKGLLREAATDIQKIKGTTDNDFIKMVFGIESTDEDIQEEVPKGITHFTNAELSEAMKYRITKDDLSGHLYKGISSTAIGKDGVAIKHSLRRMETTIPLVLEARILEVDEKYSDSLNECVQWIKRLGQNRHRGLGRCSLEIIKEGGKS